MSMAICLNCGCYKFGALTQCEECDYEPISDFIDVSIRFSDWYLKEEEFILFSSIIKLIHASENSQEIRILTFIRYISLHYPSIITLNLSEDLKEKTDNHLMDLNLY